MRLRWSISVLLLAAGSCASAREREAEAPGGGAEAAHRRSTRAAAASRPPQDSLELASGPSTSELCDGSDSIRLAVTLRGFGKQLEFTAFDYPYGEFFVLDGHCHFYALSDAMRGIHHGYLSAQQSAQLADDLALHELASVPSTRTTCFDGWTTLIAVPGSSFSCRCDDCGEEQRAASVAIEHAGTWTERLAHSGTALEGSLTALAKPAAPERLTPAARTQAIEAWPLSRAMLDIPDLIVERGAGSGASFEAEEATTLRELRASAASMFVIDEISPQQIFVRDRSGSYALHVRDELPEQLRQPVQHFLDEAWSREPAR